MDRVPAPTAFEPHGLQEGVFWGGTTLVEDGPFAAAAARLPRPPVLRRQDVCVPAPVRADGSVLFSLHTVDVRTQHPVFLPRDSDVDGMALDEAALTKVSEDAADASVETSGAGGYPARPFMTSDPPPCVVYLTGQLPGGLKVGLVTTMQPTCEVELPVAVATDAEVAAHARRVRQELSQHLRLDARLVQLTPHMGTRFKGYVPDPANPLQRRKFVYLRLALPNPSLRKRAAAHLRSPRCGYAVYEDGINPEQQFLEQYHLTPSGWHVATNVVPRVSARREMLVDVEYTVAPASIVPLEGADTKGGGAPLDAAAVAPLCIASLDCEMNPHVASRFPKAERRTDAVVAVAVVFAWGGSVPADTAADGGGAAVPPCEECVEFERRVYVLAPHCAPIPGVIVVLFQDEGELLAAVRDDLFVHKRIDVLLGHNLVGFDVRYMATRVQRFYSLPGTAAARFLRFGALPLERLQLQERTLGSAALGSNALVTLRGAGFVYLDTMLLCKQNHKLRENTLKYAAETFLKGTGAKFDLPYELIPAAAAGPPGAVALLAHYCVQDTRLPLQLVRVWNTVKDLTAQSRIITIPMAVNVQCGQQQRVRNSLMRMAHQEGMVMNGVNEPRAYPGGGSGGAGAGGGGGGGGAEGVKALGGWVMDNVPGLHDVPVVVLDFASLYPSVQLSENLCYSTYIEDPAAVTAAHIAAGLQVHTHHTATGTFRFVHNVPGVLPKTLRLLLSQRQKYKREMAAAPRGSAAYQNADAKQKATKVVMNSGYGTANCANGIMPCRAVGTVTCAVGRELNQAAERFVRETFGCRTLYGDTDSIMVVFPEPPEVAAGSRKARLLYAMEMGARAAAAINQRQASQDIRTEFEKVYFPFLSSTAKSYAGLHFAPGIDVARLAEDLGEADAAAGTITGFIEPKGMRMVRRDVPAFCKAMTQRLFVALFFHHDLDEFWDVVHDYTERIAHGRLALEDYVITAEIGDSYASSTTTPPHVAVSYAREYAVPGSALVPGDRVSFVFVVEPDARRVVRPPSLEAAAAAAAAAKEGGGRGASFCEDEEDEDGGGGDGVAADDDCSAAPAAGSGSSAPVAPEGATKRGMFARHPSEVREFPQHNHIDAVYYVQLGICSVLKQLMPQDTLAAAELERYAKEAASLYAAIRQREQQRKERGGGLHALLAAADAPKDTEAAAAPHDDDETQVQPSDVPGMMFKLSHRRPPPLRVAASLHAVMGMAGPPPPRPLTGTSRKRANASIVSGSTTTEQQQQPTARPPPKKTAGLASLFGARPAH